MAHLTHFGLDNFRVFGEPTLFEFRPITILTGTNSSGKSSLTKGILTAKYLIQDKVFLRGNTYGRSDIDLNIYPLAGLDIKNSLMIGNFFSCANKSSNRTDIKIKLPIRLTNLEHLFILTLSYVPKPNK